MRAISLYRQAGFQQRVVETETLFVQEYGTGSDFWTLHPQQDFPRITSYNVCYTKLLRCISCLLRLFMSTAGKLLQAGLQHLQHIREVRNNFV